MTSCSSSDSSDSFDPGITADQSANVLRGHFPSEPKAAWTVPADIGKPQADNGTIVMFAKPGTLTGVRISDGTTAWTTQMTGPRGCATQAIDGKAACLDHDGKLVAIDLTTGAATAPVPLPGAQSIQVIGGQLYTAGVTPAPNTVWVAKGNPANPQQAWRVTWPEADQCDPGAIFATPNPSGRIVAVGGVAIATDNGHRLTPPHTHFYDTGSVLAGKDCHPAANNPFWAIYKADGTAFGRDVPENRNATVRPGPTLSGTGTFTIGNTVFDSTTLKVTRSMKTTNPAMLTINGIAIAPGLDEKSPTSAFSISDGKQLWAEPGFVPDLIDQDRLIGAMPDGVGAVNTKTGHVDWRLNLKKTGDPVQPTARVGDGFVWIGTDKTSYFAPSK